MRKIGKLLCAFLMMSGIASAFAGGYEVPIALQKKVAAAKISPVISAARFQVTVRPGSLKSNIERISARCGWPQVVWNVPNDYQWVGTVTLRGDDLPSLLAQLLKNYPVQAVLYKGNHIIAVSPRTLR